MGWKLKLSLSLHDKKNMKFFEQDSSLWVIHSDANGTDTVQSVLNTLTIAELNFRISGHIADSCFLTGNIWVPAIPQDHLHKGFGWMPLMCGDCAFWNWLTCWTVLNTFTYWNHLGLGLCVVVFFAVCSSDCEGCTPMVRYWFMFVRKKPRYEMRIFIFAHAQFDW